MFCYQYFVQLLDVDPQDQAEEEGANVDLDSQRKGKCAVIKTSTRQVRPKQYIFSINQGEVGKKKILLNFRSYVCVAIMT